LGVFCGISKALNAQSPLEGLASAASALGVLLLLGTLWKKAGWSEARFRDLMPSASEAVGVGLLLGLLYLVLGVSIRPEALPRAIVPHLSVWILYSILIALFVRVTRRSPGEVREEDAEPPGPIQLRPIVFFVVAFGLTLAVAASVKPITTIAVLITWAVGCALGAIVLAQAFWLAVRRRSPS
jgi:hypothetical protein